LSETYYGGFYGFETPPFHITPDPTLLFPTETHRAALGAIEYGIRAGKGFIVVTGEVGVGKTTVLRVCLDGLDPKKTKILYLFSPALSTSELYASILDEFEVTLPPASNAADTLRELQRTLLAVHEAGIQVILAVDEAQNMPESTLESLRILSNLETNKAKLLQIILVGQPELESVLAKHSLRQLAQRVAVRARIKALSYHESRRYIQHRTRCAGRSATRPLFTTPALHYLAFVARGIPRTINICCDNALINGYGHAAERISLGIVRESCRAMKFRPALRRSAAFGMAVMVLIGVFVSGDAMLRRFFSAHAAVPAAAQERLLPVAAPSAAVIAESSPRAVPEPASSVVSEPTSSAVVPAAALSAALPAPDPASNAAAAVPAPASSPAAAVPAPSSAPASSAALPALAAEPARAAEPASAPPAQSDTQPRIPPALRPDESAGVAPTPASAPIPWIAAGRDAEPAAQAHTSSLRRFVQDGDSVYKLCRATYGSCDAGALHSVLAYNPQIGSNATIHPGDIIILPEYAGSVKANSE
jgi:general secretion pathway protein A